MRKVLFSFFVIATVTLLYSFIPATFSVDATVLEDQNINKDGWRFDSLVFDSQVHIDRDENKEGMSILLHFIYPVAAPKDVDIRKLEYTFMQILSGEENPARIPSEAFDNIKIKYISWALEYGKEWEKEQEEYPNFIDFSGYTEQKTSSIDLVSKYVITTSTNAYSYSGGAHGNSHLGYYNIDLRDYQVIKEEQLFKTGYEIPLAKMIQDVVRQRNSSPDENEHIMLLVEVSDIKPNENFYFSKEGIVFVYNQYEISPYVQGVVEILIPYDKIRPLLNNRYLEVIDNI